MFSTTPWFSKRPFLTGSSDAAAKACCYETPPGKVDRNGDVPFFRQSKALKVVKCESDCSAYLVTENNELLVDEHGNPIVIN